MLNHDFVLLLFLEKKARHDRQFLSPLSVLVFLYSGRMIYFIDSIHLLLKF